MKSLILLSLLFLTNNLFSQTPGFKINIHESTIQNVGYTTTIENPSGQSVNVFQTPDIAEHQRLDNEKASKENQVTSLNIILSNNLNTNGTVPTDAQRAQYRKEIKDLKKEIGEIDEVQDSLYLSYVKDYINYKNIIFVGSPYRSRAFFDFIYDANSRRFNFAGNSGLAFGNNTGSLYSEIVGGHLGVFRVSVGTVISKSANNPDTTKQKQDEAYQRLINYGGNTVLNFEYPLFFLHSNRYQYNFISRLIFKGTADIPSFGTETSTWAGSASTSLDLYADAALDNNKLRFYGNFNLGFYSGSDVFKDNLGLDNHNFIFGQLKLGLVLFENFKISLVAYTLSTEKNLSNKNVIIGGQVLR